MLPVIVAIFLAFSLLGGGVVYASENAPPSSPLHPIRVAVNGAAGTLHLVSPPIATSNVAMAPVSDGKSDDAGKNDSGNANSKVTRTPIPGPITTAFATAEAGARGLASDPSVPGNSQNGLVAKLNAAQDAISRGDTQGAADILEAFVHQLNAMERSGHISQVDYNSLYSQYTSLLRSVDANATPVPTVVPNAHGSGHGQAEVHRSQNRPGDDATATGTPTTNTDTTPTPTPETHGRGNGAKNHP